MTEAEKAVLTAACDLDGNALNERRIGSRLQFEIWRLKKERAHKPRYTVKPGYSEIFDDGEAVSMHEIVDRLNAGTNGKGSR